MEHGAYPNLFTKVTFTALLLLSFFATVAQNQVAKQTPGGTWYLEYIPPDYNLNSNKYPIVFFCHGIGERGNTETDVANVARNGPPKHVKAGYKFPFILISPQLKTSYSRWPIAYVDEVIEYCKTYLRVDLSRVYLCGLSLGGGAVWDYAQDPILGQKLAAIIPVCGGFNNPKLACNFGITNLPVWAFHGDKDTIVPLSRSVNMVNAINACVPAPNPLAKMTIYAGVAHDSWSNAYRTDNLLHTPNAYQWLLQFKNGSLIADAGVDRTIKLPTNSVTLTGTASVQGATVTSYEWTLVSGTGGTMTNASTPTLTVTGLPVGVYTYRLLVKASNGEMAQDLVRVSVLTGNNAPIANAGPDINLTLPTNTVTIAGSGSDADGSIASYLWTKVSGPTATASGTSTATLALSNLLEGTYVYSLKVTDNLGAIGTDNVTITVTSGAVNQLPVVSAGSDQTINLPTSTTNLTAVASDADGTITSYLWEKVSGPAAALANASTPTASVSGLVAGTYVFKVTVTDNNSGSASDQVSVTVVAANQVPIANAGANINLTLPTNSTNIVGSGSDADGSISSYAWTVVSGPNTPTLTNASASTVSVSNLIEGTYTLRLTVTDNSSATAIDEVQIIVNPAAINAPPVANAGGNKTISLPTNSTSLTGSGSDPDGSIASYSWTQTSGAAATLSSTTSPTVLVSNLAEGIYEFTLTVTDDDGATDTDVASVTVEAANQSPTANAGSDVTISLPTSTAVLSGSGSDPDGSIASYLWEKVSGPENGTLTNATTPTLTLTGLTEGTYVFSLTVADDDGFTDSDEVTVVVNALPVNIAPTANAGSDKSISLPTNSIILNGSGNDTDGSVASYVWILVTGPSCTLANQNTPNLSLSNLQAGSYLFRLTVTDDDGATGSDEVALTVQPEAVNQSPVANAGADVTMTLPSNSTTLNGSGTDPDGSIASHAWTQVSGPAATISGENTPTLNLSNLLEGVYSFRLTVTDDKGSTGSDLVTVTVNQTNQAPLANAGPDITIDLPTNSTSITGSGTDPDGSIATYKWTQSSGPSVANLVGQNTASLAVGNLTEGTYIFTLVVTDDDGATGVDDMKVIVNAANLAPTANAGANKSITLPTNTVVFTGSGTDPDGSISVYGWTQVGGPLPATLTNGNTPNLTVVVPIDGTYTFRLTVTDNDNTTAFDDVQLTVNAAAVNQAPTANAGPNQNLTLPVNFINLTGSGSDPDGSISAYAWTKVSGPTATLSNGNTATVSISGLVEGTYVFRLTVTDNGASGGLTATDDVTVTVFPEIINSAPVANASADVTLTLPTNSVNLPGSGSDIDGSVVTYAWTQVSGPAATLTNQNLPTLSVSNMVAGTYLLRLTVTDDKGATGVDDVTIVVNAAAVNQVPVANAGPDRTISLPTNTLTITGTGSDPDGSITAYRWTKVSGPTVTLNGATTATLSMSNLVAGTYVFRLRVTDNSGATANDNVSVTVLPEIINQSPVADAGADQSITLPTNSVNLFGSGSDPDGGVVTYSWAKLSGPAATLTNQTTPTLTVTGMVQGTYVFRLTVTDDDASIDADDVTVIVNPVATNQNPVANAGTDKTIVLPTSLVTLEGAGSDADGSIATYAWLKVSGPTATMGATNGANLTVSDLVEGTYVFRLEVTDDDGAKATDDATVTVMPAAVNATPVVNAGANVTIFEPEASVALDATASDSDGSIVTITWTQVSGAPAVIATPSTLFTQVVGLLPGTYGFRVTVEDDDGATAFDEIQVTVEAATVNQPPFANAGVDQTLKLPANAATINGSGADPDGTVVTYLWQQLSGPAATMANTNTASLGLTSLVEGTYKFSLTVTDEDGATSTDEVQLEVLPASINLAPVVNAGSDQTVTLPTASVVLTGTATDDDVTPPTLLWEILSGPTGTLTNQTQNEVTLSNLQEGTYILRLTATDAGSLSNMDEVVVNVLPEVEPTEPPVVDAGEDVEIQLPDDDVEITAAADSPGGGLIVSYRWEQISGLTVNIVRTDTATLVLDNLLPGIYGMKVTVTDSELREASDEVNINVLDENPMVKPKNLFSPDQKGDASTETWTIENADMLSNCEILVFDRQGQKVFSSIGYPVPWDGTYNGKPVPDGAYFYVIRCEGKITKSGSVTIARLK